jgi:hypothetical protein
VCFAMRNCGCGMKHLWLDSLWGAWLQPGGAAAASIGVQVCEKWSCHCMHTMTERLPGGKSRGLAGGKEPRGSSKVVEKGLGGVVGVTAECGGRCSEPQKQPPRLAEGWVLQGQAGRGAS